MKIKLLFIVCLLGALNFSCSNDDDNDNGPVLLIKELSVVKGKIGDEIIITGQGFSAVNDENVVKINGVRSAIIESTTSELKLRISEETTTGNLTITVNDKTVDYGVFNIMQKTLFALKTDYNARKYMIVIIDPITGGETVFIELPQPEEDYWYSDLCFLEKSNEFVILKRSEDEVEYHIKDPKIIRINADSKEFKETKLSVRDGVINVSLLSDGLSHVYLENFHEYEVSPYKTTFYKLDLNTGSDVFITEINNDYVKKCRIMNENNLMILMEDRSVKENSPHRIISIDLSNGTKKDIITGLTYVNGFSFGLTNNIYFATKDSYESESTLYDLDLTSGAKEVIVKMPKQTRGWYAGAVYIEKSGELVYFLSAQDDTDDVTDYMYKIDVTDNSVKKINLKNAGSFLYQSEQVVFF